MASKGKAMSGTKVVKKTPKPKTKGPSAGKSMKNTSKKSFPSKGRKVKK